MNFAGEGLDVQESELVRALVSRRDVLETGAGPLV